MNDHISFFIKKIRREYYIVAIFLTIWVLLYYGNYLYMNPKAERDFRKFEKPFKEYALDKHGLKFDYSQFSEDFYNPGIYISMRSKKQMTVEEGRKVVLDLSDYFLNTANRNFSLKDKVGKTLTYEDIDFDIEFPQPGWGLWKFRVSGGIISYIQKEESRGEMSPLIILEETILEAKAKLKPRN